jgi:hypothetical protein
VALARAARQVAVEPVRGAVATRVAAAPELAVFLRAVLELAVFLLAVPEPAAPVLGERPTQVPAA